MEPIIFNYRPDIAIKAIESLVKNCPQEQKKIFEDIETLAKLGFAKLKKVETGPAIPGDNEIN